MTSQDLNNIIQNMESIKYKLNKEDEKTNEVLKEIEYERKIYNEIDEKINCHIKAVKDHMKELNFRKEKLIAKVTENKALDSKYSSDCSGVKIYSSNNALDNIYLLPPKKVFTKRESILSTLLSNDTNIQTMYNICFAVFIINSARYLASLSLEQEFNDKLRNSTEIESASNNGTNYTMDINMNANETYLNEHILNLYSTFYGFTSVLIGIVFILISSCLLVIMLSIIMNFSNKNKISNNTSKRSNYFFISNLFLGGIMLQTAFFYYFSLSNLKSVSILCRMIFGCEILRNAAKLFSFYYFKFIDNEESIVVVGNEESISVLSNTEIKITSKANKQATKNNINNSNKSNTSINKSNNSNIFINLKQFILFNFYPTLIYSSNYPFSKSNKNKFYNIIINLFNTILSLSLCFILYEFSLFTYFKKLSHSETSFDLLLDLSEHESDYEILFQFIYICFLIFNLIFYGFWHSYHNLFAEITNFSDRKFYDNFWNSYTPLIIVKKIGFLPYELVLYGVKPFLMKVYNFSEKFAKFCCLILVCLVMEFLIACFLNIFYPISSVMFIGCYIVSQFLINFKSDKQYLVSLLIVSFGMGTIVFCLFYEVANMKTNVLINNLNN